MRLGRLKIVGVEAVYYCMSQVVNGEELFGAGERGAMRELIWKVADFSGVRVITYSVLGDQFHVLVSVPARRMVSDRELLRRCRVLYAGGGSYGKGELRRVERQLADGGEAAKSARARLLGRMGDISEFIKTLKQRISTWYNAAHDRFGPLWADRFRSVVVEPGRAIVRGVAAWIDLLAVRAGMVRTPAGYPYCGYAEAVGGTVRRRRALGWLLGGALADYRRFLRGRAGAGGGFPGDYRRMWRSRVVSSSAAIRSTSRREDRTGRILEHLGDVLETLRNPKRAIP